MVSLLKSIEILNEIDENFLCPVYIEQNTYAENKQRRNFVKEDIEKLLKISMEYFDQSIGKDPSYEPALTNKLVGEFILKVIKNCEMARYSPTNQFKMEEDYNSAIDLIEFLDKEL